MYEHPMKRAGLTFNRILFSNTKMVVPCVPQQEGKYRLQFSSLPNARLAQYSPTSGPTANS